MPVTQGVAGSSPVQTAKSFEKSELFCFPIYFASLFLPFKKSKITKGTPTLPSNQCAKFHLVTSKNSFDTVKHHFF